MVRFSGTVTFVTGASSGIGAAISREVAQRGGDVALLARRRDRLQERAREIESMGRRALAIPTDVTNDEELKLAVKKTSEEFGRIDYVVANAGFGIAGRFERLTVDDFRRQFETNVFGVLQTVYATREHLVASRGCLCIVGSVNGYIATPRLSAYCMSKFAVHGLSESLRHELKPQGVGVVLIVPGFTKTEIRKVDKSGVYHPEIEDRVPSWLLMSADEAARQIVDAMYRRRRVKIITNHAKIAVFLQRHCPGTMSAIISRLRAMGLV